MLVLPKIIVIVGPTASGKTALGLELAKKYNGEVINADSRQIYKGMDIGTAKAQNEEKNIDYLVQGIRHHLIDVVNPDEEFTLAHYKKLAFEAIDDVLRRNKLPIVVGGTGLYIWAIVDNLDIPIVPPNIKLRSALEKKTLSELMEMLKASDPISAKKIDLKNPRRVMRAIEVALSSGESFTIKQKKLPPRYEALQIGLDIPREELVQRINERTEEQIKAGLVEEVRKLSTKYLWTLPAMSGIGYKQVGYYLRGEISLADAIEMIKRDTRRYAKRQMTWFRRDKRIKWFESTSEADGWAKEFLDN
ncbi:MAG: tRNA (adenosine(37)-N6)-dimethylallyltransferase MiaA [Candidatus Magasanikbacteria bacterium]|nr:tRNA (adenosine(37)-N6)-dimethylallyltransferase MiaA [Candidatus Magasanikbacteria bacterium]